MARYKIDPYLFDDKEKMILKSIRVNNTPLKISKDIPLPRSTVYFILEKLKKRGLVKTLPKGKKEIWVLRDFTEKENTEIETKNNIKIYSDKDEMKDFLGNTVMADSIRFKSLNGDNIVTGWAKNIGGSDIIKFNNYIRDNNLISDLISSEQSLKDNIKKWREDWINSFTTKPTEYHLLDKKYSNHGAQIFLKKNKIFLINMNKPLVIEIKDLEITKMFENLFDFIKDNTKNINISEFLNMLRN